MTDEEGEQEREEDRHIIIRKGNENLICAPDQDKMKALKKGESQVRERQADPDIMRFVFSLHSPELVLNLMRLWPLSHFTSVIFLFFFFNLEQKKCDYY